MNTLSLPWWLAGYDNVGQLQAMVAERHKTIQADISQGAQLLESVAALLSQCNAITDECASNERAGGKAESEAVAQRAADIMNSFRKHNARIRMLAAVEDPMHACEELEGYASAHGKDDFYEQNCPLSWQAVTLLLLLSAMRLRPRRLCTI